MLDGNAFMQEEYYKKQLIKTLTDDFIIEEEVSGVYPIGNTRVVLDFLLYPRKSLIERGFDSIYFGIETKSPISKNSGAKCIDAMWQAHTYSLSIFNQITPAFVLLYPPPVDEFVKYEFNNEKDSDSCNMAKLTYKHTLLRVMQRGNVGCLYIGDDEWRIYFGVGGSYFSSKKGKGKVKNLGVVRYVGNSRRTYK